MENRSLSEEINRRLTELKRVSVEYNQMVSLIDGKYEQKEADIRILEARLEKLKDHVQETQNKANSILQAASDQAAQERREAKTLLEEAQLQKIQVQMNADAAQKLKQEAESLYQTAQQKEKEASQQYQMLMDRKRKLEEAAKI